MSVPFPVSGYQMRTGSGLDRALLVKFMQRTYRELNPDADISHLAQTVDQHFSSETPLWWVQPAELGSSDVSLGLPHTRSKFAPVACLWMGQAVNQITGYRQAYTFLLYVAPNARRQGIGTALMHQGEQWAKQQGFNELGLQVFQTNQTALQLYRRLGYQPSSIWMTKLLQ
ncbi:MAG: GNAT family N-acetyltransferase [Thainema sp.]